MNSGLLTLLKAALALALGAAILLPVSSGAVDLLHNSTDTASTKWQAQGGWGVEGGKYGKFTCATCHQPNRKPNIKNLRQTISTMNGENWPNGSPTVAVSFMNVTSMGEDRGGHAASNRICEVCHSQNQFHNSNTANNTGGLNHPNPRAVCTTCHKHNTGFKAACGGCHGNPPTEAVLGGNTGLIGTPRASNALESGQVGAHVTHTETRSMVCDTCHYISNGGVKMPNLSNSIDIGFFGFGGKVTSGTYVPYTSASRGFRFSSGTPNTVIAAGVTLYTDGNRCLNVYCHGGGSVANGKPPLTGGTNNAPRWDGVSQNACGSCHGTTAATPPTTAGHLKHAGSGGYSFACATCHPAIDVTHVQGSVRWAFNTGDQRVGANALYQPAGATEAAVSGATGNLAPSDAFGQCSGLYCHSDGRGGAAYVTVPTWGGSLPGNCIGCHGNNASTANPIVSKGHKAHVNNTSTRFGGFNFRCNECHNSVTDASGTTVTDTTLHVNHAADVAWGPKSTGGAAYGSVGCTQIYCHSNGQGAYKAPPTTWNAIADGQQGTIQCNYCHGGLAGSATPVSSQRHTNHIGSGPLPHRPAPCNWCHSNTVAADGASVYNGADVKHINRTLDVSFIKMGNFSGNWSKSNTTCSSTYCHASNTQNWTNSTLNGCGSCHEANNTTTANAKLSDAHRRHYNRTTRPANNTEEGWSNANLSSTNNVFMCGTCHPANPSQNHINGPAAANGSAAQIVLNLPFTPPAGASRPETVSRGTGPVQADGRGYLYSTGTSCDTYCHSDGRGGPPKNVMSWAVTTSSCGNCHNKAGDANPTWSGSHTRHLAASFTTNATCNACHAATASGNNTLQSSRRDRHPNGFRNVTGNNVAGPFRWDSATQQCSNLYCHRGKTMTWGGQALPLDCSGCHGNNATSETPIPSKGHRAHTNNTSPRFAGFNFRCQECHNTSVDATDRAILSPAAHINGTTDVAWGPKSTGGAAYATSGCSQIYCHSNGQGVFRSPPTTWNSIADGQQGTIECDYCHNGLRTNQRPISSARHKNHINAGPLPHRPVQCNWCHSNTVAADGASVFNGADVKHINRTVDVSFFKMGNFSGSWTDSTNRCSSTYCHATTNQTWTTTTLNTCGSCHEANNTTTTTAKLSDAHRRHYNRTLRPSNTTEEGWTNVNLSASTNVFMCGTCHPANPTENHINGPAAANGSAAQVILRLPFTPPVGAGRPETVSRGTGGIQADGRGYFYSTGTTCDTYCHSDARGGPPKTVMSWAVSTSSCGNCHNQAMDNPSTTTWSVPHNKHANIYGNGGTVGTNNTTTNNTFVTCAACHAATATNNTTLLSNSRARHPNGFRNISASSAVGTAAFKWDRPNNSCKNGYCHSKAYSFTDYSTPWIKWDLSQSVTCGSCHSSYPIGPDYANGYKGKANSHPKHAQFWGFTCEWCHNQTTTTGNTITNVRNHVNKSYNVVANSTKIFLARPNSFTATATTNPPTVKTTCTNVNCHGGNTSKVFTWGGTNKCGDCHFGTSDTVDYAFKNSVMATISRTEWRYSGHGKPSGSYDVTGAPFAGFSSAAAAAGAGGDPCLYCHEYDSVMHGTTGNPLRLRNFNTGVQTWGRNSVCLVCHASTGPTGVTPAAGYQTKTATRKVDKYHFGAKHGADSLSGGQFCWDCHDAHGDRASSTDGRPIAMIHRKPAKGSDPSTGVATFLSTTSVRFLARTAGSDFGRTAAPFNGICNVCHTYKSADPNKMVHYTDTASDGHRSSQLCTDCHKHSENTTYDGQAYYGNATVCDACHGATNDGQLSVNTTAGHALHYNVATVFNNITGNNKNTVTAYAFACKNCHRTDLHKEYDGKADMLAGVNYTFGLYSTRDARGYTYSTGGTCATNACHNDGKGGAPKTPTVTWTNARSASNCGVCHNKAGDASPTWSPSHTRHVNGYSANVNYTCSSCHSGTASNNTTIADMRNHVNGTKTVAMNSWAGGTWSGTTCSSTYCHSNGTGGTANSGDNRTVSVGTSPSWGGSTTCVSCHGSAADGRPNYTSGSPKANSHMATTHAAQPCTRCHESVTGPAGSYTVNAALHANKLYNVGAANVGYTYAVGGGTCSATGTGCHGTSTITWGGTLDCVSCHGASVPSPIAAALDSAVASRVAITPDFSLASKHIRSRTASPAVTKFDCCVCHLEGDVTTGGTTSFHKDGRINLRDPDTGLNIKGVTHSGSTSAAGAYGSTTTDAAPVRFSRNLGNAAIEPDTAAIMVNFCLKCHDANGASNSAARLVGATAGQPFGAGIAANPGSNVLDVASQFASSNRSFHPVMVRQNSGYTNTGGSRMVAPWNGVAKTGSTTVYGPLITCWDCHAPNGTASTVTLTKSGVHGAAVNGTDAVQLRGNVYVNGSTAATNLCLHCHVVSGGTTNHGTGSAITSTTNGSMNYFQNRCYFCHASDVSRTRPWGAGDAHGYNARGGVAGNNLAFPAANNGYAFIRSEGWYGNSYTQSVRQVGASTYTPTCGGRGSSGGGAGSCSRSSMGGYTPGGVY